MMEPFQYSLFDGYNHLSRLVEEIRWRPLGLDIEQVADFATDVLAVAYNLAAFAAVGSSHSALVAQNRLVLAPPEELHGSQAPSVASRHRAKLLPTCHSDPGHLLFVPHVAAWQRGLSCAFVSSTQAGGTRQQLLSLQGLLLRLYPLLLQWRDLTKFVLGIGLRRRY